MPLFEELQRQRTLMLNEDMSRVRVTRDDIYKWIEDSIIADGNDAQQAEQMMEFGLNQEIIDDETILLISMGEMRAEEAAAKVIQAFQGQHEPAIAKQTVANDPMGLNKGV
jgi:hypothetical protein